MTGTIGALETWFSQFEWPVYGEGDVPVDAELPYITVRAVDPEWDKKAAVQVQLWSYTKENAALADKADAIAAAIGVGVRIPFTGGIVVLWPDNPLQQIIPDGDERRVLMLLQMNSYHVPGV